MSRSAFDVLCEALGRQAVPVASGYQPVLLDNVFKINSLFPNDEAEAMNRQDRRALPEYQELLLVR